jgi:hypothetical protein
MTAEYASLCLVETGWDLEQAIIAFNINKVETSPKTFLNYLLTLGSPNFPPMHLSLSNSTAK